jgi:hypothetical protein
MGEMQATSCTLSELVWLTDLHSMYLKFSCKKHHNLLTSKVKALKWHMVNTPLKTENVCATVLSYYMYFTYIKKINYLLCSFNINIKCNGISTGKSTETELTIK